MPISITTTINDNLMNMFLNFVAFRYQIPFNVVDGVNTTLLNSVAIGATSINLVSPIGAQAGNWLIIDGYDLDVGELVRISPSWNGTDIPIPLQAATTKSHPAGASVNELIQSPTQFAKAVQDGFWKSEFKSYRLRQEARSAETQYKTVVDAEGTDIT